MKRSETGPTLPFDTNRPPLWRIISLRPLVEDLCESLDSQLNSHSVRPEIDIPKHQYIAADPDMLRRAVLNLMLNAIDAMPDGGDLVITSVATRYNVELEIGDSGVGLTDGVRDRIFEARFSTKDRTGLGLTVVNQIMEALGGEVTAMNCPEGGAAFTLRIPQVAAKRAAA